jgi:glycosyltransferase involved in cell wall biosynthesis
LKVAAIVPAYNEAARLAGVLTPLLEAPVVDEIIVVDDGSTDGTAGVARQFCLQSSRVRLIELPENQGKGGAMRWGARNTDADVVLFLDADLSGLRPEHPAALLAPVLRGEADMAMGVFRGGGLATDLSHWLAPGITGQRAMARYAFLSLTAVQRARYGVETLINRQARAQGWRISHVVMCGVSHPVKERKIGWVRGVHSRLKMYLEIAHALTETRDATPDPAPERAGATEYREAEERP